MVTESSPKSIFPQPGDRDGWIKVLSNPMDGLSKHLMYHLSSAISTSRPMDSSPIVTTVASILTAKPSDTLSQAQFSLMQMLRYDYQILVPVVRESRSIRQAFAAVIYQDTTHLPNSEQKIYENTRKEVLTFLKDCKENPYWSPSIFNPGGTIFLQAAARYTARDLSTFDSDVLNQAATNKYLATEIIKTANGQVAEALSQEGVMEGIASTVITKSPQEIDLLPYPHNDDYEKARWNIFLTLEGLSLLPQSAPIVAELLTHSEIYETIASFLKTTNPSLHKPDEKICTMREESKATALKILQNLVTNDITRSKALSIIMNGEIISALAFIFQRRQSLEDLLRHGDSYSKAFSGVYDQAVCLVRLISPQEADRLIKRFSSL